MFRWAGITRCLILVSRHKARIFSTPKLDGITASIGFANIVDDEADTDFEWPLDQGWPRVRIPYSENPLSDDNEWLGCRVVVNRDLARYMDRRHLKMRDAVENDDDGRPESQFGASETRRHELAGGRFILMESSEDLPPISESLLPAMAVDLVERRHVNNAGVFAEWYLKSKPETGLENAVVAAWRRILQQPVIPYDPKQRPIQMPHAFEELREEIAAWTMLLEEERRQRDADRNAKPKGAFPAFTHANQVKKYLRDKGIIRELSVRNVRPAWEHHDQPFFGVYISYTRAELTHLDPATPSKGNPFEGVSRNHDLLPDYERIQKLLRGSNAAVSGVISPKDDV